MAGYSARQSSFTTGDTITAAHSNNEFNAILAAFHVSTGHTHDGTTAGDGGPLSTLYSNAISMGTGADTDIAVTFNANSNDGVITWMEDEDYFQFSDDILLSTTEKVQFRDTAIYINSSTDGQLDLVADTEIQIAATTVDINGNVDISGSLTLGGTAITSTAAELNIMDGGTSATSTTVADADRVVYNDAGTMKQVAVTDLDTYISATSKTLTNKTLTSPVLNTGVSGTAVADEDDMSSNSATKLATQQSIKAYVDAQITAEDLDITSDSGTIAIDLDSETLTIAGGTGLASSATSNTVTLAIDSTVTTLTGSQTLTNKTLTSPVLNTGVSGTAVLDEDNLSSDSATKLATQQSIKAYVDSSVSGVSTSWVLEDDDGTEVSVASGKEVKFIGSGLTTNWTDTDNGTDGDPYDLTFTVDAAQTGITSLLATDIKIGEDDETKIDFETANEIHFYANNTEQVYLADNIFGPQSDSDVDLGTTGVRWKDAYIDTITTTGAITVGGDLTVNGTTTTVNSTTITVDDPIFTLGGDSAPGSDDNKDRGIEFRWHNGTAAKVGFFGYDDSESAFTFIPDASNSSEVFSGTVGNVIFGNIAGTLTTAAQTNITSVGALDGGSITSGFGTIDTGSSNITTTGLISGGSLDIDDVLINGTTIGHTDDTDLLTLASGALTVAGTIEGTTITASTAVVPDASGGADLGSTSLEWGDLYIADDKKIYLGSDQNLSIEYDEDGNDTTAVVAAGGVSMAPHGSSAGNGTELRFQELAANGAHYVGFKAPDSIAANKVFVLPNADGTSGQFLTTDGSTNLSWGDAGGGGSANFTANGSITAGKAVILQRDGKVAQVTGTSGTAVTFNTDYTYNEKFDNGNVGANSFYSYDNILNKHTGMYFFIDRQLNSYYLEPYGTTAGTGQSTYNQMIAYSIDADGNFTISDIVEPHANSIWGTALIAIPGTDIQVLSTMDNNSGDYNYFLRAFTYRDGEFTFGTAAQVTTHNAYDPHSSASLVWDVSADAGVFTHQDFHTSDFQKVKSRVFTVDENTLAITLGSEQDVGTTTGEIGYTGAGNRNSTVVGLVYDEDNEFVVHVRSYRKGKGTEDVDAYAGEVTGGTTRSISWGSKQTIFADGTGTNVYDRPFHAIYDKTSNRLVVAVVDTNGDSGDHANWTSDILNITIGSDKSMTVNGNTNYISGTHSGNGGIRPHIEYIDDISKYMIFYNKIGNSGYLTYRTFTTSGTSFTFDTEVQLTTSTSHNRQTYPFYGSYGINYDSINKNWSFWGKLNRGGRHSTYAGLRGSVAVTASNLHEGRLLGLAAASVSDGASVEITHTGGSNTNSTGLYKGIDVIVNNTGDIHQRVAGSSVLGKYAAVVGRALTATTVAVNTSATTTGGGTQGPNYLELGAGDQLPRLDGGKLYGINDNFLPLWKNIYNDRWKWSAGATSHAISIPLDYYKGSNPFMYKLVAIIQDVGDAQNTYHMRLNDVSTSVYADGSWFTRAGYDSGSQTPGAYNSYGNNQSEFRNVAAQLNTVTSTSERMFSYLEFTVVRRMMFDSPAELTTARDAGYKHTSGGIWDMMPVENQGMRWRPCWWKSYNIEGETTSNAAGTNGRITDIHGSGLWYPSTTAHTELTSLNLISGTSENFQIKYALFVNSVDSGWARVNYTDINSNT